MQPITRRAILAGTTVTMGSLAGCSAVSLAASESTRVGRLTVDNYDAQPYTVDVVLIEDGELTYWRTEEVSAATEDVLGGSRFEGYPTQPEDATLYARLANSDSAEWSKFDFSDYADTCLGITIAIGEGDDREAGDVTIQGVTDSDLCENKSAASYRTLTIGATGGGRSWSF